MSYETVARRYAQAIFELGVEAGTAPNVCNQFGELAQAYQASDELRMVLDNPLVPEADREALLRDLGTRLGFSEVSANAALLLLRRRRIAAVPDIARQLSRLLDEHTGVVRAVVTSATPLSDAYLTRLKSELERMTGKKVIVAPRTDPALIAGVVTQIGDRVIDGSIRARIDNFRDALLVT